jgi:ABC-type glycerol-3-phosphate transport system permease component
MTHHTMSRGFALPSRSTRRVFAANVILVLLCFIMLAPIVAVVLFTFQQESDILRKPPLLFPCDTSAATFDPAACRWSVEGYERVLMLTPSKTALFGRTLEGRLFTTFMPNSVLYASAAGLLVTALAGMAGLAAARYRFKGRDALMILILALSGLPWMTDVLALYQMGTSFRRAAPGFDDRLWIIIVYTGFWLPMSIWIAKGFFEAIPRDLEEAGLVDGCAPLGAFMRISVSLAAPGLASIFLLTFVSVWNEFIAGFLLISRNELMNAMFGIYDYLSMNTANPQVVAAACVVIAAPVVIVFLLTRKSFFQAMAEGAIKG